ncbi:hypothetical protein [Shimazuella kribbensis]|uniref:hypothetical protein n=1 Tax=Shimazuella kribbensis TaxID=139808 RepID=UPI00048B4DE7|nr:hypothetical protein [Shimazuella kribbensis]
MKRSLYTPPSLEVLVYPGQMWKTNESQLEIKVGFIGDLPKVTGPYVSDDDVAMHLQMKEAFKKVMDALEQHLGDIVKQHDVQHYFSFNEEEVKLIKPIVSPVTTREEAVQWMQLIRQAAGEAQKFLKEAWPPLETSFETV